MAVTASLADTQAAPEDIGATLRNARETAGYSITDVAQRMRLSRHHIENLEAERFDLFPVSVFLRGYLTSYARLLGIDSVPLLEAYDRRGFGPPQLHSQDTARSSARGSEFTVTITTLIVIAVLIVLSALWWREQWTEEGLLTSPTPVQPDRGDLSVESEDTVTETIGSVTPETGPDPLDSPESEAVFDAPVDTVPTSESDAGTTATAGLPDTSPDEAPERDAGRAEESGAPPPGSAEPESGPGVPAASRTETAGAGEGEATESEPADALGTAPGGETAPPVAGVTGALASLVIRVSEDCWLMIRDAEQRLVYRDLAAAGTVLELSASAPIRVVAGYAHGLEVEFNGKPFDLSPHIEQDTGTARFRLGS